MSDIIEAGEIREATLAEALSERYLNYALSTIMSRSLPDVRDGLKPVHRRLLHAMREMKLDPKSGFKKCARIVGDTMGKYHPHGDSAIYDALVRLAQEFAQRYPLVDGQGNFGNVDGDNAAAMRYTEARLTEVAEALLEGIDQDTVDFRETYDGEEEEPVVLPAAFPNLLANGATGIAVGMATSIPPHNVGELSGALLHLIKHRNASTDTLMKFVPGPDFPTGGVLIEAAESIRQAYGSGRGGFRLRARWEVEPGKRGTYAIVVSEIPYQVAKARIVEKIAELLSRKKLPLLGDVRDESAEDIRLVLEPRNGKVPAELLMQQLFRQTELEVRFPLNMNVLDADQTPRQMGLREVLNAFLDHRDEVLVRRTRHRLAQIARRLEILEGYLVAYLNLDEVIRIVREEDEPKAVMMARFELNPTQVEAILDMRLRALRRLEEIEIAKEHAALLGERGELDALLGDEAGRWRVVADEIREMRKRFGGDGPGQARRTTIEAAPELDETLPESLIEREPITVICSQMGWIRAIRGHLAEGPDARYKEGDRGRFWLHAETTDRIVVFATNGRFYTLEGDKLSGGRGHGEPVRLMVDLGNDEDIVALMVHRPGRRLLVASSDGRGFIVEEDQVLAQTRAGKQVLNPATGEEAQVATPLEGDHLAVVGDNRKLAIFSLEQLPEMTRGRGVRLQRYKDGGLSDARSFTLAQGLSWRQAGGRIRTESDLSPWLGKRGAAGRLAPKGFPRDNKFT